MHRNSESLDPFCEFTHQRPLTILTDTSIKKLRLSLQTSDFLQLSGVYIYDALGQQIESKLLERVEISSKFADRPSCGAEQLLNGKRGCSTKKEESPFVELTLREPIRVSRIDIANRSDSPRSFSLVVEGVGINGEIVGLHDNWARYNQVFSKELPIQQRITLAAKYFDFKRLKPLLLRLKKESFDEYKKVRKDVDDFFALRRLSITNHGFTRTFRFMDFEEIKAQVDITLELIDDIEKLGLGKGFVTSGTLLGFIRDGAVIPHDDDIDIAVVSELTDESLRSLKQNFIDVLTDAGWNVIVPPGNVNLRVGKKSVSLDLFLGWREHDGSYSISPLKRYAFEYGDLFPVQYLEYPLGKVPVPKNYVKLLNINYGEGWKAPDPSWTFDWKRAFTEFADIKG